MPEYVPGVVSQVKRDATARLLAIPGVTMVAVGGKETSGQPTGELVVQVYVRAKRPPEEIPLDELIPEQIDGVKTDVIVGGDFVPLVGPPPGGLVRGYDTDGEVYRPALEGGSRIRAAGAEYEGTMGCLLWDPADHEVGYGLTCNHVIDVADVRPITVGATKVGQPRGVSSSTKCCDDIIGVYAGGQTTADRDEALVQLAPGMKWKAKIIEIGLVAGTYEVKETDVERQDYAVRKRGARTRLTGGMILGIQATTGTADNLLVIRPNDNPDHDPQEPVFFNELGDSGAALVNEHNQVVGLVRGRSQTRKEIEARTGVTPPPPPGGVERVTGFAYPIAHVLARFAAAEHITVEVATATSEGEFHTVPGGSTVAVPPELAERIADEPDVFTGSTNPVGGLRAPVGLPWFSDGRPPEEAIAAMRRGLDASDTGRLLISLWLEHQHELTRLVGSDRCVKIAWHRGGGAALFQLLLRMLSRPDLELPETVNGRPVAECVDGLCDTLIRRGSPELGNALTRVRADLPDLAGRSLPQIMIALGAVPEQVRSGG